MKEKNMQEFGEVDEYIELEAEYSINNRDGAMSTEAKVTKRVELKWGRFSTGGGMSIGEVLRFQVKANALLRLVRNLLADGTYVTFTVTKAAYEHVPEHTKVDPLFGPHQCSINQLEFNSWKFEGNALDDDAEEEGAGLYLRPNTEYTEECWDMILYWKEDVLKSLAEAHL